MPVMVIVSLPPSASMVPATGPPVTVMVLATAVPVRVCPAAMPAVQTKLLPVWVHPGGWAAAVPGATRANPAAVPKPMTARPIRRAVVVGVAVLMITLHP
ncbi:hypothetical protein [Amycolatopsis magusensis]|uniref:hypothetical protein n=1 Tax=Amycolatopsis magusensis TaxID=882444 RepID=UPI003C303021